MNQKKIFSPLLIMILTVLTLAQLAPNFLTVPKANAVVGGGNPAIVGLFSETAHSNALFAKIGSTVNFDMDVNVTDAVNLDAFDINITFNPSQIHVAFSSIKGTGTPACLPCLFANVSTFIPAGGNVTDNVKGILRLDVVDTDGATPFVGGTHPLFRIRFVTQVASANSVIHIESSSSLQNPSSVPINTIDGYVDGAMASVFNFGVGLSLPTANVLRPILASSTNMSTAVTTTLTQTAGTAKPVTVTVLGLPTGASAIITGTNPCIPGCSVSIKIQVTGGPKGGAATTPSGVYRMVVLGSAASPTAGTLVISAWLKLTVNPPHPPIFSVSVPKTKIRVDDGNFSLQTVTATLTSGANDSLTWGSNVTITLPSCSVDFNPPTGSFGPSFSAAMNVTCNLNAPLTNMGNLTLTAQTTGTYSEVFVTHTVFININVTRTHDLQAVSSALSKGFSYAGISLATGIKFNVTVNNNGAVTDSSTVNGTAKTKLNTDAHIGFQDKTGAGVWKAGDPVTYDPDGRNGAPTFNSALKTDSLIKYIGTTGTWVSGDSVVYDTNNNGLYAANDPIIFNSTNIPLGTSLKSDPLIKYVDTDSNNVWDKGESVVYDPDNNNLYEFSDTVIANAFLTWIPGEPIIANSTDIPVGAALRFDPLIKFVDSHYNKILSSGDAVAYDAVGSGLYASGDTVIAGTPPSPGILVGSQAVTLTAGQTMKVTFTWDPSALPRATYIIEGSIAPVPQEYIIGNNNVMSTSFTQRLRGDVAGHCKVDIVDLASVGSTFGKTAGVAGFNPAADLDNNGAINIVDLVLVASSFGSTC